MGHSFELSLREQLAHYLTSESTPDDFKAWLVSATWNRNLSRSAAGSRFASEIKLLLAEHSGGFRSEEELQAELVRILHRIESDVALTA